MQLFPKKNILITGGAGFLGSHLSEALLKKGHNITCLDNFLTGSQENIAHLLDHPQFSFILADVCEPLDLEVDEIYNLACPASPEHYMRDPLMTTKTCVLGAMQMLSLAKSQNARILQASTSEIYGDPAVHPQPESYFGNVNPIGPRACYDEGKRCAETLFFDAQRKEKVSIAVARIFNTYGPRMNPSDGRVISNFIVQALQSEPITVYGTGRQTRSFCYVDDLIEGLIALMESGEPGPMNLGNPNECSILELAHQIVSMTGSSSSLIHKPPMEDDPKLRCPDIAKAKELLGWEPKVSLQEGLIKMIPCFIPLSAEKHGPLGP